MNCLVFHNSYKLTGGEDSVVCAEQQLLIFFGHQCCEVNKRNAGISGYFLRIKTALSVSYSSAGKASAKLAVLENRPDIVHVHNFFPIFTPSIYEAFIELGVPVIQTLHNYRTICPGALLMREGQVCEKCVIGTPYQAVLHRCYRNSRLGTLAVARMVDYHRKRNTWATKVDHFIALTEFAKAKFIEAGFPEHKIAVKPNFYSGKGVERHAEKGQCRTGALFVGRVSPEKGIRTLVKAWAQVATALRVVGDGPLLDEIQHCGFDNLNCLGQLSAEQVSAEMTKASFLVMPSEWYEGFPMVLVEAFAHGLPVIASRLGGMAEIVKDGVTGLHFEPGNAEDLAAKVRWMNDHPEECRQMGYNARREFEAKYTPERNYEMLMKIYQEAIDEKKKSRQS